VILADTNRHWIVEGRDVGLAIGVVAPALNAVVIQGTVVIITGTDYPGVG